MQKNKKKKNGHDQSFVHEIVEFTLLQK